MSEELIYKDDPIKQLCPWEKDVVYVDKKEVAKKIEKLKAVDVIERKRGEWIMHIDDLFPCESTQECSVCHAEQLINGNDDNFCPNCGADMRPKGDINV